MITFTVEKCKSRAGYLANLKSAQKLNLQNIQSHFEVVLETPILLVVKVDEVEVVVHGFGELLFKHCDDIGLMKMTAERIYEAGLGK